MFLWIRKGNMKSLLIRDTTKEERREIVRKGLSDCGEECEFCSGCDSKGGGDVDAFFEPYIKGEMELKDLNFRYRPSCGTVH